MPTCFVHPDATVRYVIAQNKNGRAIFAKESGQNLVRFFLFRIEIRQPNSVHEIHVLAGDKESAIAQARCVIGIPKYDTADDAQGVKIAFERIPFAIRGWGQRLF